MVITMVCLEIALLRKPSLADPATKRLLSLTRDKLSLVGTLNVANVCEHVKGKKEPKHAFA